MKIVKSRIKRWAFKQRLFEIQQRLEKVKGNVDLSMEAKESIDEALQIIYYWMDHMRGEVEKSSSTEKKRTASNLW